MANFVINEWLWADSAGDNGSQSQRETFNVITTLAASSHQIVLIEDSRFDRKAWGICKSTDRVACGIARAFVLGLRLNSDRCLVLKPEDAMALPEGLAQAVKEEDHYLVQAQLTIPGAILVTTDGPLRAAVREAGLECLSREEFLAQYF